MTSTKEILVKVATSVARGDAGHLSSAVRAIEKATGESLGYELREGGTLVAFVDREAAIRGAVAARTGPALPILLSNGKAGQHLSVAGYHIVSHVGLDTDAFELQISMPAAEPYISAISSLVGGVGGELEAYLGGANAGQGWNMISGQVLRPGERANPPFGLPAVRVPSEMADPALPNAFNWVNYWSERTVELLKIVNSDPRCEVFDQVEKVSGGGLVVALTKDIFSAENPSHLARLRNAYERFPEVGGRRRLRSMPLV